MRYKVTTKFTRKNVEGQVESSERMDDNVQADDVTAARVAHEQTVRDNEPDLVEITEQAVEEMAEGG